MREIKFRGKRIDTGEWVYGFYFKSPLTDENSGLDPEVGWFFLRGNTRHCISTNEGIVFVVDEKTVGQDTGLKDKNRKEIYEDGLSLAPNGNIHKIECLGSDTRFVCSHIDPKESECFYLMESYAGRCEIIGNIFDNQELIDQKTEG